MTTGIDSIDRTLQKTNEWISTLAESLPAVDRKEAYVALRAVLHALRDRLPTAVVAGLGAQLPLLLRGLYYEGWHPTPDGKPLSHAHGPEEFYGLVARELVGAPRLTGESAVEGVYLTLERHVDPGELDKVRHALPRKIQPVLTRDAYPRDA